MPKPTIDVAAELGRLGVLTLFELRAEWRRLHRMQPPMRLSRDLLIRGITYKLQERALGGLSKSLKRKLEPRDATAQEGGDVRDCLEGRQPVELSPTRLLKLSKDLPVDWPEQWAYLGFVASR